MSVFLNFSKSVSLCDFELFLGSVMFVCSLSNPIEGYGVVLFPIAPKLALCLIKKQWRTDKKRLDSVHTSLQKRTKSIK